ncbi:HtaA domain-containing protein [Microbacterium sp. 179-B 1A2 NHS]|uniref:HtaA domain-containing protein n=1 Tax=Microbacterium sp. 179-B 1A2 NHS TaxID=3142383 RepID=UPI0039A2350D
MPARPRTLAPSLVLALLGALAAAPAPASAADTTACTVTQADVVWDAGTAALEASGSATLEATTLRFSDGAGVIDPVGPVGSIAFDATLTFVSDAGVQTTLTNPTLLLTEGSGQLLFDVQPEGTALVPQSPLASVDLRAGAITEDGAVLTLTAVEAATERASDAAAFWEGDPGTLDLTAGADCPPVAASGATAPATGAEEPDTTPWVVFGVVGGAALLAALLAVGSVARRRRNAASLDEHPRDPLAGGQ